MYMKDFNLFITFDLLMLVLTCSVQKIPFYSLFQVWLHAPYELHLSLFEHFIELLTESRYELMQA